MSEFFTKAKPVFPKGKSKEMNITAGFHTAITYEKGQTVTVNLTAANTYRLFINGEFFAFGPVRCGKGTYRCDCFDVSALMQQGVNHLAVEVSAYNVNSYYLMNDPGFLWCEVYVNGESVAATGTRAFQTFVIPEKVQRVQRYSFQRPMVEVYRLKPGCDGWRVGCPTQKPCRAEAFEPKPLTQRGLPHHTYPEALPFAVVGRGTVTAKRGAYRKVSVGNLVPGEYFLCFPENELKVHLSNELNAMKTVITEKPSLEETVALQAHECEILEMKAEKTGFLTAEITVKQDCDLYFTFSEQLVEGDVPALFGGCVNAVKVSAKPGVYRFMTAEPYSVKFLKLICTRGEVTLHKVAIKEYICPVPVIAGCPDPAMQEIWDAAVNTFCQNAPDVFTDCPSRERAGWLCDSFFTARTERLLTGDNKVEEVFLENFALASDFEPLPEAVIPMCYPSDHPNGCYIPNWCMWFVLELNDMVKRGGSRRIAELLRPKVYALCRFFEGYLNENNLLEDLDSWVFVEWSEANEFTDGVNFPCNMLFARMLRAAGELYADRSLTNKGDAIMRAVNARSFDGRFYHDHEERGRRGGFTLCPEITETCQYYAFFTGAATPVSRPELWRVLTEEFGPDRVKNHLYEHIFPSNAFIGNYLRLELLSTNGLKQQCLNEMKDYFGYMARATGTLWENMTSHASCNHGFASYAACLIDRCIKEQE